MLKFKIRRISAILFILTCLVGCIIVKTSVVEVSDTTHSVSQTTSDTELAINALSRLIIKNHASSDNYSREQFGGDWNSKNGCDTRNIILNRDLKDVKINEKCQVISGKLNDPYSGKVILFQRGSESSSEVQIDHVVALSNAWQTGAQNLDFVTRVKLANDPLELLAVDGVANQQKSSADASMWLPSNQTFVCEYVVRQIAVKLKYNLWVTLAEHDAMKRTLSKCDEQTLPIPWY